MELCKTTGLKKQKKNVSVWHQQYFSGNTPQDKRVEPLLKQAMKTGWLMLAPASTRRMLEQYCASALLNRQADCSHKKWDVIERVGLFEDWLAPPSPDPLKQPTAPQAGLKSSRAETVAESDTRGCPLLILDDIFLINSPFEQPSSIPEFESEQQLW